MIDVNYISIKQKDGYITKLIHYMSQTKPKASILILHGMAEHHQRYLPFAEYLVKQNFDVFCYNHRGHGTDKQLKELGFLAIDHGHQLVINDVITVSNHILNNNRAKNFYLFAHSMGSLIARNVLQSYDKYNGIILSGTTHPSKFRLRSGLFLSSLIIKLWGPKHPSPFLNNLLFEGKKYTSLSSRTAYDWLSRSNPIVGSYIHDPYCGFVCTASFYRDLIKLTLNATNKNMIMQTRKNISLFIISGERDPVSNFGKEINKYLSILKNLEFTDISHKLYPDCRHELLNELNKDEVYSDISQWILKNL